MMTTDDPLLARAKALKLHGLLAHWEEVAGSSWLESLIQWEEEERARRSLERRLGSAHLGRFRSLAGSTVIRTTWVSSTSVPSSWPMNLSRKAMVVGQMSGQWVNPKNTRVQ